MAADKVIKASVEEREKQATLYLKWGKGAMASVHCFLSAFYQIPPLYLQLSITAGPQFMPVITRFL